MKAIEVWKKPVLFLPYNRAGKNYIACKDLDGELFWREIARDEIADFSSGYRMGVLLNKRKFIPKLNPGERLLWEPHPCGKDIPVIIK
jgi:hypothetical protein